MYCSWIGKICIFVTMINSQDKILQKTEHMIYFHIMFMSASSIKRKSTLLLREATRSFIFRSATTFPGRKHLRECFPRLQIRDAYPNMIIALGEPCRISHYGIYSEAPERSRPFPTAYFILRCKHTNDL